MLEPLSNSTSLSTMTHTANSSPCRSFLGILSLTDSDVGPPLYRELLGRFRSAASGYSRALYGRSTSFEFSHGQLDTVTELDRFSLPPNYMLLSSGLPESQPFGFDIPERGSFVATDCLLGNSNSPELDAELGRCLAHASGTEDGPYTEVVRARLFRGPFVPGITDFAAQLAYISAKPVFVLANSGCTLNRVQIGVLIYCGVPFVVWFSSPGFAQHILQHVNEFETRDSIFYTWTPVVTLDNQYLVANPLHLAHKYSVWKTRFRNNGGMFTAVGCLRKYLYQNTRGIE